MTSLDSIVAGLVGALVCLATGAVAAEPGVGDKEIVIGQSVTLQGGQNAYGSAVHLGAKLYIDNTNAAGGVNGRRITLRTLDDDNKPTTAEANARKLVQDGAFVLFGAVEGGPSTAVAKVAMETGVPFIGPLAGPPALRRPHQAMVFPVRAEHRDEFRALLQWARNTGLRRVGLLHADAANGREHLENVKLIAQELGLQVVLALPFKQDADAAQLAAMVSGIAQAMPDVMLNHGSASLYERLIKASRQAELKTVFMAVNSGSSQMATGLGPLAQGMVFSQVVPSPWERKREITREYQDAMRKFDPNAKFTYGSLEGYLTAKTLVHALRASGRDLSRAALLRTLEQTQIDLGGVRVQYRPGDHEGSRFVDLSMVSRDGRFIH